MFNSLRPPQFSFFFFFKTCSTVHSVSSMWGLTATAPISLTEDEYLTALSAALAQSIHVICIQALFFSWCSREQFCLLVETNLPMLHMFDRCQSLFSNWNSLIREDWLLAIFAIHPDFGNKPQETDLFQGILQWWDLCCGRWSCGEFRERVLGWENWERWEFSFPCSGPYPWPPSIFFFFFLQSVPTAHGCSQARGQIGAAAAGLHRSHCNTRLELYLWPTPQLTATPILDLLSKARDRTRVLMDLVGFLNHWAVKRTPEDLTALYKRWKPLGDPLLSTHMHIF